MLGNDVLMKPWKALKKVSQKARFSFFVILKYK